MGGTADQEMNTVLSDFVRGPIFKSIMETQYGNVYKPAPRIDIPTGGIVQYGGVSAPTSWLFCDGAAVERSTYADLFAALGGLSSPYGLGNNVSTFNVPDLRGRVPMGAGTGAGGGLSSTGRPTGGQGLTARALGAYDGDERLQAHTHSVTGNTGGQSQTHTHTVPSVVAFALVGNVIGNTGFLTNQTYTPTTSANNRDHTHAISLTSGAHSQSQGATANLSPSLVVNYLIRT